MRTRLIICALLLPSVTPSAFAQTRSSASYAIIAETTSSGGARTTSASYANDGSVGLIAGASTVAAPAEFDKSGYIGQLYEVTGLSLSTSTTTLNETTGTAQLGASQLLDDSSTIALAANAIAWNVVSGPITSISGSGLAAAGTVYQDTTATVRGSYSGSSGTLSLTVLNVSNDDLGIYAGDGIDDAWQVQYFGLNNPSAAPNVVTDGSGLTNLFKYTAGLIPNNAASTFTLTNAAVPGQPGQRTIVLSPSLTDRTYTVQSSTDLIHWNTLSGPFAGNGATQTVTDIDAGAPQKFYRVQVTKP